MVNKNKDVIKIKIPKITNKKLRENPWIVSTFVLGVLSFILLFSVFTNSSYGNIASAEDVGENVVSFLNSNADTEVTLGSVSLENGLYKLDVVYQGKIITLYSTTDGNFLIQNLVPIEDIPSNTNGNTGGSTGNSGSNLVSASEDDDAFLGDENAPVTIIEFSDYQCPFCRKFWRDTLPLLKSNYIDTGKVKFVYRDFPLSSLHPMAQGAAEAAECVRKQGGDEAYFEMHDKMFEEQDKGGQGTIQFTADDLKQWAQDLGYDISECLDSGEFTSEVLKDTADAQAAGGSGTPYFIINGIPLSGAQPFSAFQQVIEGELS